MKRCNKRPFHAASFTFVPACSHQPGAGRQAWCPPDSALLGPLHALPPQASLNRAEMSWLGRLDDICRDQEPLPFFALEKQGQLQPWRFAASQLETAAIRSAGKRKGLTRLQRCWRGSTGLCVRSWTGTEGSACLHKARHKVCSAEWLSLICTLRKGLCYLLYVPAVTRLWSQLVIASEEQ